MKSLDAFTALTFTVPVAAPVETSVLIAVAKSVPSESFILTCHLTFPPEGVTFRNAACLYSPTESL